MRSKILLIFLTLCAFGAARKAEACSCSTSILNDRDDAEGEFAAAAMVFEGEVLSGGHVITAPSKGLFGLSVIVFRVLRSYKGTQEESVQVYDAMAGSTCAFGEPKPGEKFLVYGYEGKDGKIYVEACTRTRRLEFAAPDIRYARGEPATEVDFAPAGEKWRLRSNPNLVTQGATLRGRVQRDDGREVGSAFLTVWDVDNRDRRGFSMAAMQKVNKDGSYEVRYLSPGRYIVTAEDLQVTHTARFVGEFGKIQLIEGRSYSDVNVLLHSEPLGGVSIRVIAPQQLHDRLFVWLRDSQMNSFGGSLYKFARTAHLDVKNTASFESVPYGLYDAYVMLTDEDSRKPSWTHDDIQVRLSGSYAEAVVELRKPGEK
jgi:hypothetical protein